MTLRFSQDFDFFSWPRILSMIPRTLTWADFLLQIHHMHWLLKGQKRWEPPLKFLKIVKKKKVDNRMIKNDTKRQSCNRFPFLASNIVEKNKVAVNYPCTFIT